MSYGPIHAEVVSQSAAVMSVMGYGFHYHINTLLLQVRNFCNDPILRCYFFYCGPACFKYINIIISATWNLMSYFREAV